MAESQNHNTTPTAGNSGARTAPPRLLVIDDEQAVLKMVKTMLTRAQYQVVTAASGQDALKLLTEDTFDCVITDAVMPVMSGYDFVKAVRRHPTFGSIPVLMLTRKRHRQDVKKAVEAGVTDYVLKPIDEHLLLDKVELCIKKGGGKRHIFECPINGERAVAEIGFDCRITSMSETDITIRVPFEFHSELPFRLSTRLFDEIGITVPLLRLNSCDPAPAETSPEAPNLKFEAKFVFLGVPETDLRKIRGWVQKQEILRRK